MHGFFLLLNYRFNRNNYLPQNILDMDLQHIYKNILCILSNLISLKNKIFISPDNIKHLYCIYVFYTQVKIKFLRKKINDKDKVLRVFFYRSFYMKTAMEFCLQMRVTPLRLAPCRTECSLTIATYNPSYIVYKGGGPRRGRI